MRNPKFLAISRHGIYYFRWPIPSTLFPNTRPSTIKVSLRTRNPQEALRLARRLSAEAEDCALMDQAADRMTLGEVRAVLTRHFASLLAAQKAAILEKGRLSKHDIDLVRNTAAIARQVSLGTPLMPDHDEAQVRSFIDHYDLPIAMGTPAAEMLGKEISRAHRALCDAVLAYDQSLEDYDLEAGALQATTGSAPAVATRMTLRDLTDKYTADRIKADAWTPKTARERGRQFALLHELLGAETDVRQLTAADRERVRTTLFELPKNRNKNPLTVGLSIEQAIQVVAQGVGVEKLNLRTTNKYLQTYTDLFRWAELSGHTVSNAFERMKVRQKKERTDRLRTGFTTEQVQALLTALLNDDGSAALTDSRKWGTLIGIYTGARLNEIAQMDVKDVRCKDGVWCFDFNADGPLKHMKNDASPRIVPVHRRLIELGLITHVQKLTEGGETKLFPDFGYDKNNGWGRALGRWFNDRFLPKLNLKTKQLVFHSFRHTMVTHLRRANVEHDLRLAIVGHTNSSANAGYMDGHLPPMMADALHKLPF